MTEKPARPWPPYYYERDAEGTYHPGGLTRSPWDPAAIAGGPFAALMAHGAEDAGLDAEFEIARFTLDIFGKVPRQPLTLTVDTLRDGRQTKLHRVTAHAAGRPVGQAHVLRVLRRDAPRFPYPGDYPAPETVSSVTPPNPAFLMAGGVEFKPVSGGPGVPGPTVAWLAMHGEVIRGEAPSTFVKACHFADYGNGFGSVTDARDWSYANLDITVQFLRRPVGEWFLIDADTHMAGNGHGTAACVFADVEGVYARTFETVFVAPGHESRSVPTGR